MWQKVCMADELQAGVIVCRKSVDMYVYRRCYRVKCITGMHKQGQTWGGLPRYGQLKHVSCSIDKLRYGWKHNYYTMHTLWRSCTLVLHAHDKHATTRRGGIYYVGPRNMLQMMDTYNHPGVPQCIIVMHGWCSRTPCSSPIAFCVHVWACI